MNRAVGCQPIFAMIVTLAMSSGTQASVVDVNTLGSPQDFSSGGQVNLSGTDPVFGALFYNSVAAVVQVGTAGVLSQVDLQVAGTGNASLRLYLLPVTAGAPATSLGDALGSWSVASPQWSSVGAYPITSVDLSSARRYFSVGDWYALALVSDTADVATGWATPGTSSLRVTSFDRAGPIVAWDDNVYGSGTSDVALRTHMSPVPLPAAVWLLLSGIGGLGWLGRRSQVTA